MKKLILFLALSAPLFWGCDDDDDDDATPQQCVECNGVRSICEGDAGVTKAMLDLAVSADTTGTCKLVDK